VVIISLITTHVFVVTLTLVQYLLRLSRVLVEQISTSLYYFSLIVNQVLVVSPIDFNSEVTLLHHVAIDHLLSMHLSLFLLQVVGALRSLLQNSAFVRLEIGILSWSLSSVCNSRSQSGVEFIFQSTNQVLVRIWSLEGEVVH
jgi:hypothetical protein